MLQIISIYANNLTEVRQEKANNNEIPPAEAGGFFKSYLYTFAQPGDREAVENKELKAGLETSSSFRWRDFVVVGFFLWVGFETSSSFRWRDFVVVGFSKVVPAHCVQPPADGGLQSLLTLGGFTAPSTKYSE